jgi:hypothetical protein
MTRTLPLMIVLALSATIARGEDLARAFLQRHVGSWHSKTLSGDNKGFGVMSAAFSEDKTAVLVKEKIFALDMTLPWNGRAIIRSTEKPNTLRMYYSAEDGTQFEDEFTVTKEGTSLSATGTRRGFGGDGKSFSADLVTSSPNEDQITLKATNGKMGDKKLPDLTLRFTRVKHDDSAR